MTDCTSGLHFFDNDAGVFYFHSLLPLSQASDMEILNKESPTSYSWSRPASLYSRRRIVVDGAKSDGRTARPFAPLGSHDAYFERRQLLRLLCTILLSKLFCASEAWYMKGIRLPETE
jgi:hypothetical protein